MIHIRTESLLYKNAYYMWISLSLFVYNDSIFIVAIVDTAIPIYKDPCQHLRYTNIIAKNIIWLMKFE